MDSIVELARQRNLKVIEDCAQAHGATYKGRQAGSMGDAGAFSFCQDKIITTGGEGGMLGTNDAAVWGQAWSYKDHGKGYDALSSRRSPPKGRRVRSAAAAKSTSRRPSTSRCARLNDSGSPGSSARPASCSWCTRPYPNPICVIPRARLQR